MDRKLIDATDEARNDRYPRKVQCRWCPHKYTVWNEGEEHSLRAIGCINCARDKMRGEALRDRRLLR